MVEAMSQIHIHLIGFVRESLVRVDQILEFALVCALHFFLQSTISLPVVQTRQPPNQSVSQSSDARFLHCTYQLLAVFQEDECRHAVDGIFLAQVRL